MRFLGIGDTNDLGDLYLRLQARGHSVRVCVRDPEARDTCEGLVEIIPDWRDALPWVREAGDDGLVLFETASDGLLQDRLRDDGFHVIGGSAAGDRLEADRAYGQAVLAQMGLRTAPTHDFDDFDRALDFLRAHPSRCVFKPSGGSFASTRTYVGVRSDGADVAALLRTYKAIWPGSPPRFVLMEHREGVEVGVGAYFDGQRFLRPACLDFEHKRFFPNDLGELTMEMGTLVTFEQSDRLFDATLARMERWLADHRYCGYINLNTIVNDEGIWPLEFTCRFGYPGFAILDPLQEDGWDEVLRQMAFPGDGVLRTRPGFSLGVVLTVPPYPHRHGYAQLSKGLPISFLPMSPEERDALHFGEVALQNGELVASGLVGYLMVATGTGPSVEEARARAYAVAEKVVVPNLRYYRTDIGERFLREDRARLEQLGFLSG